MRYRSFNSTKQGDAEMTNTEHYVFEDATDEELAEFERQEAAAAKAWLARYVAPPADAPEWMQPTKPVR
jgi:hypothetical protein